MYSKRTVYKTFYTGYIHQINSGPNLREKKPTTLSQLYSLNLYKTNNISNKTQTTLIRKSYHRATVTEMSYTYIKTHTEFLDIIS